MRLDVRRLSPALGAELRGLDLSAPLDDAGFDALRAAWLRSGGVLVIRGQHALAPEDQLAFSRRFGPLFGESEALQDTVKKYLHPEHPGIYRVSNKVAGGQPMGRARAGDYWHSDVSFRARPAMASILLAIELPELGGDTLFASQYAAWDGLSATMRGLLGGLLAVHDFAMRAALSYAPEAVQRSDFDGRNRAVHPVAIRHPETGRRALFVNPGFTDSIDGLERGESDALLGFLFGHACRDEFVYRHRWETGDLVVWDNRCVMHRAVSDYASDRYLHRTTVIAAPPVA